MDTLNRLQRWYLAQCDDEDAEEYTYWEHMYGVSINTLDNPGWIVDIDLVGTDAEDREFISVDVDRSDRDWIQMDLGSLPGRDKVLRIACGPLNLEEALTYFLDWAWPEGAQPTGPSEAQAPASN